MYDKYNSGVVRGEGEALPAWLESSFLIFGNVTFHDFFQKYYFCKEMGEGGFMFLFTGVWEVMNFTCFCKGSCVDFLFQSQLH